MNLNLSVIYRICLNYRNSSFRTRKAPARLLLELIEYRGLDIQWCPVETIVLTSKPSTKWTPYIINAGDLSDTEEFFLNKAHTVLNELSEYSNKPFYTQTFFSNSLKKHCL